MKGKLDLYKHICRVNHDKRGNVLNKLNDSRYSRSGRLQLT